MSEAAVSEAVVREAGVALLSLSAGLAPFFEPRHHALGETLAGMREALSQLEESHADMGALARAVGQEHGLYAHLVPEDGAPIDVRALVLVREMLGYACPVADAIFAVQGLGSTPIALAGSDAQKARILPEVARGDRIAAFALTEPEAGSDVASLQTRAVADGDGHRLSGHKTLISNATIADHFVVFANANPEAGRKGIGAFLVEKGAAGLEVTLQPMSMAHPIGEVVFDGTPAEAIGAPGEGFKLAMRTLDTFRISVGAAANGMATAALVDTLKHVTARKQFGVPLADQQLVQGKLADMATELDAARLLVARAAYLKAAELEGRRSERPGAQVAMAKLFATEAAQRIIDQGVQLHGGRGVLSGTRVEALYRDIRPLRIYEGTSEIQKLIIARALRRGGR